jgi:hypothetical protein
MMEDLFSSFQHQGASKAVSTRWRLIVWPLRPATWSTDATTAGPTFEAYRFAVDPNDETASLAGPSASTTHN